MQFFRKFRAIFNDSLCSFNANYVQTSQFLKKFEVILKKILCNF